MSDALEVCAICDIAGCYHIRERKARAAALMAAAERRELDALRAQNENLTQQLAELLEGPRCRWSDCALSKMQHEHRLRGGFTGGV